ncbi:type II toxin-antitoxin system RelE/ParE family toxin [Blastomonas sp.]|uniref:type II toxin-antitoxin system RelE/ParE family toxin n=1 Tax=Blastomonas sp. TaxID=1909299 RepID=UPI002622826B|nr:type II toxin-antitoxin system RelE/ParE family toxin [Blastomonas sp.]MDM7955294.1 type II toxin-antitoxin system RelE/ParE family toxin [Blastomonas sp.]
MAEYRLTPAAQRDLDSIFDYTVAQWGLAQATDYTDFIEQACTVLANAPLRAPTCDAIRQGYRRQGVGRHVIYFRETNTGISVVRILHQRMNAAGQL